MAMPDVPVVMQVDGLYVELSNVWADSHPVMGPNGPLRGPTTHGYGPVEECVVVGTSRPVTGGPPLAAIGRDGGCP
jgi:hypothetical protein